MAKKIAAIQTVRLIAGAILLLLFLTAANTYFGWNIGLPRIPLCTPVNCAVNPYPTNPFFNPTTGQTVFSYIDRADGTNSPIVNINCQSQGQTVGILSPQGQCLYTVSAGSTPGLLSVPIGLYGDNVGASWTATPSIFCGPLCPTVNINMANWGVKLPNGISDSCAGITFNGPCLDSSGFSLTTGTVGTPTLLDPLKCPQGACVGDPTCTSFTTSGGTQVTPDRTNQPSSSCWQSDVQIIQQAQTANPPCIEGVTVCITNSPKVSGSAQNVTLTNPINGTSTYTNPFDGSIHTYAGYTYTPTNCPAAYLTGGNCVVKITVTPIQQKIWYLYRFISSLTIQIVPPTIQLYCVNAGVTQNGQVINGCIGNSPTCPPAYSCSYNPTGTLQAWLSGTALPNINKVDVLTNTQIAFGVTVPGTAALTCSQSDVSSGNCWWGIIGLWIGGQGLQTAGCSGSSNTCSFAVGTSAPHSQLPIYSCPQMTSSCSATLPLPSILTQLATATNQTVASVIASQAQNQVFSYITTQNFGTQYSCSGNACTGCTLSTLGSCFNNPTPMIVNVPLIYDILGTRQLANWVYQYPAIPPAGGANAGNIIGYVKDTSGNPIAGACVGIGGLCSNSGVQYQRYTNAQGFYTFSGSNLPAPGTYSIYVCQPCTFPASSGYVASSLSGIQLSVGQQAEVDFTLNAIPQPPNQGQWCLIPPITVPPATPFSPPTYLPGILCLPPIPSYVLPAILILAGLGLVAVIFLSPAGSAATITAAGLISSFRRGRRR